MYTCTENYVNYYATWQYHVPFSNFILYSTISAETQRKFFKICHKQHLEFESIFFTQKLSRFQK